MSRKKSRTGGRRRLRVEMMPCSASAGEFESWLHEACQVLEWKEPCHSATMRAPGVFLLIKVCWLSPTVEGGFIFENPTFQLSTRHSQKNKIECSAKNQAFWSFRPFCTPPFAVDGTASRSWRMQPQNQSGSDRPKGLDQREGPPPPR